LLFVRRILKCPYAKIDYPALDAASELYNKFAELARMSQDFGQYATSQKCYEILGNNYVLFYLYGLNKDMKALGELKEKYNKEKIKTTRFLKPLISESEEDNQKAVVETSFLLPELCDRQIGNFQV